MDDDGARAAHPAVPAPGAPPRLGDPGRAARLSGARTPLARGQARTGRGGRPRGRRVERARRRSTRAPAGTTRPSASTSPVRIHADRTTRSTRVRRGGRHRGALGAARRRGGGGARAPRAEPVADRSALLAARIAGNAAGRRSAPPTSRGRVTRSSAGHDRRGGRGLVPAARLDRARPVGEHGRRVPARPDGVRRVAGGAGHPLACGGHEPASISEFAVHLGSRPESPLTASSLARMLSTVRGFHRFLLEEGLVEVDVAHEIRPPKLRSRLPKAITRRPGRRPARRDRRRRAGAAARQGAPRTALRDRRAGQRGGRTSTSTT